MRLRAALVAALIIAAGPLAAMMGANPTDAATGGPSRAVVVADSGTGIVVRGIEFESDSISGVEALQLAGLAPVIEGFSGQGGAVCALQGVGCPSDGSCLTCDPRGYYWAYHRAPAGAGGYTYSRAGAGSTQVHDGDVEGWKWGTGSPPPFHSFASVFPEPAPQPTPPAGGDTGGNGSGGAPAVSAGGGVTSPGAPPGGTPGATATGGVTTTSAMPEAPTTTATVIAGDGAPSTSVPSDDQADQADQDAIAFSAARSSRPVEHSNGRGWVISAGLFALTLGAVTALVWRARRARRQAT